MKFLESYRTSQRKTVLGIILQRYVFSDSLKLFSSLIFTAIAAIVVSVKYGDDYADNAVYFILAMLLPALFVGLKMAFYAIYNAIFKK